MIKRWIKSASLFGMAATIPLGCHTGPTADSGDATASASVIATPPVTSTRPTVPDCDAEKLWFAIEADTPEARRSSFVTAARAWEPPCRVRAMTSLCAQSGCDEVISDPLLAAADPVEDRALRRVRIEGNQKAVVEGRAIYKDVAQLAKYALSIKSSPRSGAYRKGNMSASDLAEAIVNGDPCMDRMKKDFARVAALQIKLDGVIARAPSGLVGLKSVVSYAQNCVNCADDRSMCDEMAEPLKDADETLRETESLILQDRKALASSSK